MEQDKYHHFDGKTTRLIEKQNMKRILVYHENIGFSEQKVKYLLECFGGCMFLMSRACARKAEYKLCDLFAPNYRKLGRYKLVIERLFNQPKRNLYNPDYYYKGTFRFGKKSLTVEGYLGE